MASPVVAKNRPARTPAPPLPPFEALDRTHHKVIEVLGQFERLLAHLDENGADDVARASAAEMAVPVAPVSIRKSTARPLMVPGQW